METPLDDSAPDARGGRASSSSAGALSLEPEDAVIDPRTGMDMRLPRSARGMGRFSGGCCMMRASFALYSVVAGMTMERLEDIALRLSGEEPHLVPRYVHHRETIDLMDPGEPLSEDELETDDEDDDYGYFRERRIFGDAASPFAANGDWERDRARRAERLASVSDAMVDPLDESLIDAVVGDWTANYKSPPNSTGEWVIKSFPDSEGPSEFDGAADAPGSSSGGDYSRRTSKSVSFLEQSQQDFKTGQETSPSGEGKHNPGKPTSIKVARKSSILVTAGPLTAGSSMPAQRSESLVSRIDPRDQKRPRRQSMRQPQQDQQRRQTSAYFPTMATSRKPTVELVRIPRPPEDDKFWRPPLLVRPGTLTPLLGRVSALRTVLITHMASDKDPRPSRFGGPDNLAIVPWAFLVVVKDELIDDDDRGCGNTATNGDGGGGGGAGRRPTPMPASSAAAEPGPEEAERRRRQQRGPGPHSLMVIYGDIMGVAQGTARSVPLDYFFFHPKFTQIMLSAVLLGHRSLADAKMYYDVDGENYNEDLCCDLEHW